MVASHFHRSTSIVSQQCNWPRLQSGMICGQGMYEGRLSSAAAELISGAGIYGPWLHSITAPHSIKAKKNSLGDLEGFQDIPIRICCSDGQERRRMLIIYKSQSKWPTSRWKFSGERTWSQYIGAINLDMEAALSFAEEENRFIAVYLKSCF